MANFSDLRKEVMWEAPIAAPVIQSVHPWSRVPKNLSWGGVKNSPSSFVAYFSLFGMSCVKTRCIASCKSKETIAWMLEDSFWNLKHGPVWCVSSYAECRVMPDAGWCMCCPLSASCSHKCHNCEKSMNDVTPNLIWFPANHKGPQNGLLIALESLTSKIFSRSWSFLVVVLVIPVGYRVIAVPMPKGTGSSDDMNGTGSLMLGIAA